VLCNEPKGKPSNPPEHSEIVLVSVGEILGTGGATDEIARQKRLDLVSGLRDPLRVQEIYGAAQDIARALARERLKLLELSGSIFIEPYTYAHVVVPTYPKSSNMALTG